MRTRVDAARDFDGRSEPEHPPTAEADAGGGQGTHQEEPRAGDAEAREVTGAGPAFTFLTEGDPGRGGCQTDMTQPELSRLERSTEHGRVGQALAVVVEEGEMSTQRSFRFRCPAYADGSGRARSGARPESGGACRAAAPPRSDSPHNARGSRGSSCAPPTSARPGDWGADLATPKKCSRVRFALGRPEPPRAPKVVDARAGSRSRCTSRPHAR